MAGFSLAADFMTQDFRHACRSLARSPGFAAIAILTLGIGIGLNTALFSIINVMLFKPLAVERGDELIWLSSASTKPNGPRGNLTYPDVADLDALDVLRGATAFGFFQANLAATAARCGSTPKRSWATSSTSSASPPRGGGCWRHRRPLPASAVW